MAKKPSVCVSIPIPIIYLTNKAEVTIVWIQDFAPPPVIHLGQKVTVFQDPIDPTLFVWNIPTTAPNKLSHVQLTAPLDPDWNALIFTGNDENGDPHYSETYFHPSRPVPFDQDVECKSYDYPDPEVLRAEIRGIPK